MCDDMFGAASRGTYQQIAVSHRVEADFVLCRSLPPASSARHRWLGGCRSLSKMCRCLWLGASLGMHPWLCCQSASLPKHHWYVPISIRHFQWRLLPRRMSMARCRLALCQAGLPWHGEYVSELLCSVDPQSAYAGENAAGHSRC